MHAQILPRNDPWLGITWPRLLTTVKPTQKSNYYAIVVTPSSPRVVLQEKAITIKERFTYRTDSNVRPGRLLNFSIFLRGRLKEAGAYSFSNKFGEDRKDILKKILCCGCFLAIISQ